MIEFRWLEADPFQTSPRGGKTPLHLPRGEEFDPL